MRGARRLCYWHTDIAVVKVKRALRPRFGQLRNWLWGLHLGLTESCKTFPWFKHTLREGIRQEGCVFSSPSTKSHLELCCCARIFEEERFLLPGPFYTTPPTFSKHELYDSNVRAEAAGTLPATSEVVFQAVVASSRAYWTPSLLVLGEERKPRRRGCLASACLYKINTSFFPISCTYWPNTPFHFPLPVASIHKQPHPCFT